MEKAASQLHCRGSAISVLAGLALCVQASLASAQGLTEVKAAETAVEPQNQPFHWCMLRLPDSYILVQAMACRSNFSTYPS